MDNKAFEPDFELETEPGIQRANKTHDDGENDSEVGLKREIGLFGSMAMVVGSMIGSGIFVTPGGVLENVGSVWMSIVMWVLCGVVSAFGAMCYIELGTVVPSSGGEYAYISKAFGSLPAFMVVWVSFLVLKPASVAIGCLAFSQYFVEIYVPMDNDIEWGLKLVGVVAIFFVTFVNCQSVKWSCRGQVIATGFKLSAFAIVVAAGLYNLAQGKTENLEFTLEGTEWDAGRFALALYSGLWGYDGWNQLNYVTEEVKNPEKHLPKAIMAGLPMVTLCYVMVNISLLTLLNPYEFTHSASVATEFGKRAIGSWSCVLSLAVAMSTMGTAHGQAFTSSRMTYAAGREGHLMSVFSYIDARRNTPTVALIFNSIIATLMAMTLDIYTLVDFFTFTAWIFYGAAIAALIRLRFKMPDARRPFKVPLFIPCLMILVSVYLILTPMISKPRLEFVYSLVLIAFGLAVYVPFIYYGYALPGTDKFTRLVQLILQVAPPANTKLSPQKE